MHTSALSRALRLFAPLAFLLSAALQLTAADTYEFRTVAMGGGGFVSGLVFHPTEKDLLYARTDVGGAYRWNADSKSWIPLNDDIGQADSQLLGVLSIATDARNPDRLYLACGQYLASWARKGAILRSSDRGATWSRTELSICLGGNQDGRGAGERLQVDPNDGNILFLGSSQDGLWRSADAGASWARVAGFTGTAVSFVVFDPRSGSSGSATQTLYTGIDTSTGYALWRSTDAGTTWTALPGQPSGLRAYRGVVNANGVLYCTLNNAMGPNSVTSGAVWKFNPDTSVWTNITPPTGQGGFAGLSLDRSRPGTLMVSTQDRWSPGDEIYRSTDDGATWIGTLLGATKDHSSAPYAASSSPHWLADVQIDPNNPDHALFVTGYGLYSTANATASSSSVKPTWTFTCNNLEETVPLALIAPTSGPQLVTVVGDLDGFRHTDTAVSPAWGRLSPNLGTTRCLQFAPLAPAVMVRLGDSNGQYSTDGAVTWTAFAAKPSTGNGTGNLSVSADGKIFLWTPTSATAYWSSDKGATWTASTGLPAASSHAYAPIADEVDPLTFCLFDKTSGTLYRSVDGAKTFAAAATGLPKSAGRLRAATGRAGELWLAVWGYGLYRSSDTGTSFQKLGSVTDAYLIGFGKASPNSSFPALFLWGKVGTVEGYFRSDDAGATWNRINDALHQFGWCNDLTGDPNTFGRLYIATGGRGVIQADLANPPSFTQQPAAQAAALGSRLVLDALVSGASAYQWYHDGVAVPGATSSALEIASFSAAQTGTWMLKASNPAGNVSSNAVTVATAPAVSDKLSNISTRASVTPEASMVAGFVISGTQSKRVLIRASGPALEPWFKSTYLADPVLTLHTEGTQINANDNWDAASTATIASSVGAFGWTAGSKDAALVVTLRPGSYTATVSTATGSGVALVEVYDADPSPSASWLSNISTRSLVTAQDPQIAGFAISGSKARRLLLRASGPALKPFGIANFLSNPQCELRSQANALLESNQDWTNSATLLQAFASTGAFGWDAGSRDAALLSTLNPANYTALITNTDSTQGIALVEVYDYP